MLTSLFSFVAPKPALAATTFPSDYLRNQNSLRCLSLVNTGTTNGTVANQWDCLQNSGQRWTFVAVGPSAGTFETQKFAIKSTNPSASNKCLSLNESEGYGNGSHFQLWDCLGNHPAQAFYVLANAEGSYYLKLAASGRCLGVDGSATGNTNGGINQWDCLNVSSQRWKPTSQEAWVKPVSSGGFNSALHGSPYDNPWATDLAFSANAVKVAVGGIVRARSGATYNTPSCGWWVRIEDSFGFNYLYCHGATSPNTTTFAVGQYVAPGTFIFNRGNTGTGTAHLHFEMMWRPPNERYKKSPI